MTAHDPQRSNFELEQRKHISTSGSEPDDPPAPKLTPRKLSSELNPAMKELLISKSGSRTSTSELDAKGPTSDHLPINNDVAFQAESSTYRYRSKIFHLECLSKKVTAIAYSPTRSELAVGSSDCEVELWNPSTGESRGTLGHGPGNASAIAYSPKGNFLAIGSHLHGKITLWNLSKDEIWRPLTNIGDRRLPVLSIAFSSEGDLLASQTADGIRISSVYHGRTLSYLTCHSRRVHPLLWSANNGQLAYYSSGGVISTWDLTHEEKKNQIADPFCSVLGFAYSADQKRLLSVSSWRPISLNIKRKLVLRNCDPLTGVQLESLTLKNTDDLVIWTEATFSPRGEQVAVWWRYGIEVFETFTGASLQRMSCRKGNQIAGVAYSPDGKQLALIGVHGPVEIWDERDDPDSFQEGFKTAFEEFDSTQGSPASENSRSPQRRPVPKESSSV